MRNLQRGELLSDPGKIFFTRGEVARVLRAHLDVWSFQQPPRQTAKIPFRARVGSGSQNNMQALSLRQSAKFRDVSIAGKIKLCPFWFMDIPKQVSADCIQPHGVCHAKTLGPIFVRNAGEVHFATTNLKRLAVQKEVLIPDGKGFGPGFPLPDE